MLRIPTLRVTLLIAVTAIPLTAQVAVAPPKETEAESKARLARRGAGLAIGGWQLRGVEVPAGVDASSMPLFSGFVRKGLDARLALENGVSLWRRVQTTPPTGGIGGTPGEEVQSWIIAQTTAVRFFPFTDAGASLEPWFLGGGGFTIGIDDRETNGGGVLGGSAGGTGVAFVPAVSLQGGAGVEWWFGESFGLTGGARYQWTRFFQDFGGERTYQGPTFEAGMTYKFRFN